MSNTFGTWLREQRQDRGMTLVQFSKAVGLSYVSVCRIELGKTVAGPSALRKFANYLDVPFVDLRRMMKGEEQDGVN